MLSSHWSHILSNTARAQAGFGARPVSSTESTIIWSKLRVEHMSSSSSKDCSPFQIGWASVPDIKAIATSDNKSKVDFIFRLRLGG